MEFKYKCNYLFNICFYLILTLFVLTTILIFQKVSSNLTRSILLLLTIILLSIWSLFLKRKLEITKGTFEFTKDTLNYTTLGKTYYIEYNEIEYILKEEYLDTSYLISRPSYQYIIKIKNGGTLTFKYYDYTLDTAINSLCTKTNYQIKEL